MTTRSSRVAATVAVLAAMAVAVTFVACGDDNGKSNADSQKGTAQEQAFLQGMVPHHMDAIQMAEMAQDRATKPQIRKLAKAIVKGQGDEVEKMNSIYGRLFDGVALKGNEMAHERLGLSPKEAGMDMSGPQMMDELMNATRFDREFIDMMIPHHQGAIRMARAVLRSSRDPELRQLAQDIVSAQSREIQEMNAWRTRWYGSPSPAGGVPTA